MHLIFFLASAEDLWQVHQWRPTQLSSRCAIHVLGTIYLASKTIAYYSHCCVGCEFYHYFSNTDEYLGRNYSGECIQFNDRCVSLSVTGQRRWSTWDRMTYCTYKIHLKCISLSAIYKTTFYHIVDQQRRQQVTFTRSKNFLAHFVPGESMHETITSFLTVLAFQKHGILILKPVGYGLSWIYQRTYKRLVMVR